MKLESNESRALFSEFFERGYYDSRVSNKLCQSGIHPVGRDWNTITYEYEKVKITLNNPRTNGAAVIRVDDQDIKMAKRIERLFEAAIGVRFKIIE